MTLVIQRHRWIFCFNWRGEGNLSDIRLEITALRWREQLLQKYSYTTRSPFDGCRNEMETEERRRGGGGRGWGVCTWNTGTSTVRQTHTQCVRTKTVPGTRNSTRKNLGWIREPQTIMVTVHNHQRRRYQDLQQSVLTLVRHLSKFLDILVFFFDSIFGPTTTTTFCF